MADRPDWAFGLFTPDAIEAKREYYMSFQAGREESWGAKQLVREESRIYSPRPSPHAKPERNAAVWADRKAGATLRAVAEKHGISPERVRQIVAKEDRRLKRRAYFDALRKQKEEASHGR